MTEPGLKEEHGLEEELFSLLAIPGVPSSAGSDFSKMTQNTRMHLAQNEGSLVILIESQEQPHFEGGKAFLTMTMSALQVVYSCFCMEYLKCQG